MAAAIGVPDPVRTKSIKAFVVLKDGFRGSPQLVDEIRSFVRDHLAKHEVPRDVEFVAALREKRMGRGEISWECVREADKVGYKGGGEKGGGGEYYATTRLSLAVSERLSFRSRASSAHFRT